MELRTVDELYKVMSKKMGEQNWWPQNRWMETVVGSILIQNASAKTVDPVIDFVGQKTGFDPRKIDSMSVEDIAEMIKSAGLYNSKAKYLKASVSFFKNFDFNISSFSDLNDSELRKMIRSVDGIGNETADVWMLYIFGRKQFIADSYSRRLFEYLGLGEKFTYESLQKIIMENNSLSVDEHREFHALIDEFGKVYLSSQKKYSDSWLSEYSIIL
ncbi:MAG: DNA repair protein [Lactobacillaceae bacterium]|jgi:endonuclease-3 related protein|nr:DNA repair protein [Lactobacillaceae bacterium]